MLEETEVNLLEHISYLNQVTTSQQHEGSTYSVAKSFDFAFWKTQLVKKRIGVVKVASGTE